MSWSGEESNCGANITQPLKGNKKSICNGSDCLQAKESLPAPNASKLWERENKPSGHRIMVVHALGVGKAAVRFCLARHIKILNNRYLTLISILLKRNK